MTKQSGKATSGEKGLFWLTVGHATMLGWGQSFCPGGWEVEAMPVRAELPPSSLLLYPGFKLRSGAAHIQDVTPAFFNTLSNTSRHT